jgi:hypothetical protein
MAKVGKESLVASRIAAGFMVVADAADQMEIPRYILARAEAGTSVLMDKYLPAVARVYGVREGFLKENEAPSGRVEILAASLLPILKNSIEGEMPKGTELRLKDIRMNVGFTSAKSAADLLGWKAATYAAHENGGRTISTERMIGYALAMGVDPNYAVTGKGEMLPVSDISSWWAHRRSSEVNDNTSLSWTWLNKGRPSERLSFPLISIVDGLATLVSDGMVSQPATSLPSGAHQCLYGVVENVDGAVRIIAVDPRLATGKVLRVRNGRPEIEVIDDGDYTPMNPLGAEGLPEGFIFGSALFITVSTPVT